MTSLHSTKRPSVQHFGENDTQVVLKVCNQPPGMVHGTRSSCRIETTANIDRASGGPLLLRFVRLVFCGKKSVGIMSYDYD
ncbi:unnamed protein product [Ceratitis capitata]|uniref:(Mediterranean fruit fly) hypothetical protein n=1 Tax=Ceratitis capitata TaxID=7213 RepID=A0A811VBZ5_CERCA|nr:unnamed protein product [Ceratitis capitata]